MNIRSFVAFTTCVGAIMVFLFVAGIFTLRYAAEKSRLAKETQVTSLALSRETSDNSFGLTADVRSYVASGTPLFKQRYFNILDVRSGKTPRSSTAAVAPGRQVGLDALYDEAGFTAEEKRRIRFSA